VTDFREEMAARLWLRRPAHPHRQADGRRLRRAGRHDVDVALPLGFLNRHGLIAGADRDRHRLRAQAAGEGAGPERDSGVEPFLVFRFCDEKGLPLVDLEDLRAALFDALPERGRSARSARRESASSSSPRLPTDLPDRVLAQLGHRVQHAVRAFTPKDARGRDPPLPASRMGPLRRAHRPRARQARSRRRSAPPEDTSLAGEVQDMLDSSLGRTVVREVIHGIFGGRRRSR
jgi:Helicase HerA-like C-terminal